MDTELLIRAKELLIETLKHARGKHNQLSHGYRFDKTPSFETIDRYRKSDPTLLKKYLDRAREVSGTKPTGERQEQKPKVSEPKKFEDTGMVSKGTKYDDWLSGQLNGLSREDMETRINRFETAKKQADFINEAYKMISRTGQANKHSMMPEFSSAFYGIKSKLNDSVSQFGEKAFKLTPKQVSEIARLLHLNASIVRQKGDNWDYEQEWLVQNQ